MTSIITQKSKKRLTGAKDKIVSSPKGQYESIQAASAAKIARSAHLLENIDLTLFKQNGHIE